MKFSYQENSVSLAPINIYTGTKKMDAFRDTQADYFEDLRRGKKEPADFERYQRGGSAIKLHDERDIAEAEEYKD